MGLFDKQVARKPNHYPWTQDIIDALWTSHWTPNEFNFRADYNQFYNEMTEQEREVIVRALTAIGQVEIAVKTFWGDLGKTFPHPYISDMGYVMANNEVIHNQAYEKLLNVLMIHDAFEQALKEPVVAGRVEYLRKHLEKNYKDEKKQFIYALILFTLFVENTSLFGQFYIIMYFNRFKNLLKDTAQQVQYTRLEEMLHAKAGIMLINTLREEYPEYFDDALTAKIVKECREAVQHEANIAEWILGDYESDGLCKDTLVAFMKGRINDSLDEIGFPQLEMSDKDNALLPSTYWMDEETLGLSMTDFFQKRPTDYAKNHRTYNPDELF